MPKTHNKAYFNSRRDVDSFEEKHIIDGKIKVKATKTGKLLSKKSGAPERRPDPFYTLSCLLHIKTWLAIYNFYT
jgi:hypothetical protein